MSQNTIGEHIADVIGDMENQIVVGRRTFAYVAQVFISKIWVFDGFEARFRARIQKMQEDNSMSTYSLKVLKPKSVDTTAYLTFQRSSDNLRALRIIEGSWFGEAKVLNKGKFLWARPWHFTNERSIKGDLGHITYETKSEDVKAFNEKHYVAQKENVWGLVYGSTEREMPVDRGSARQSNGRESLLSRLNISNNESNKPLSSLMTLKIEPPKHEREDSQKRMAPSESTDSIAGAKPAKKEKAVDTQKSLLEIQGCALECFAILDEYIRNEVEEAWRELGMEREVSELLEELVVTVVNGSVNVDKWTAVEYSNNFF